MRKRNVGRQRNEAEARAGLPGWQGNMWRMPVAMRSTLSQPLPNYSRRCVREASNTFSVHANGSDDRTLPT